MTEKNIKQDLSKVKKVIIRQVGSPIGRPKDQRLTLIGLGLNKMSKEVVIDLTPSALGMVNKVKHLLNVQEYKK
jgi:large subunit ribosomal protein L30